MKSIIPNSARYIPRQSKDLDCSFQEDSRLSLINKKNLATYNTNQGDLTTLFSNDTSSGGDES